NGSFRSSESSSRIILSSRVRWSRLENTVPSWMRQAKGKANTLDKARVSTATAWQEWPKMYSGEWSGEFGCYFGDGVVDADVSAFRNVECDAEDVILSFWNCCHACEVL